MNSIIEYWQYYDFLFPEQSLPYVLIIGLFLSLLIDSDRISILNLARQSNFVVNNNKLLLKAYAEDRAGFTYFWIICISALSGSLVYMLLKTSTYISIWLALIMQIFFSWQAFPIKRYLTPILNSDKVFKEEGTMIGLAKLRSNLDNALGQNTIIEIYHLTLRDYLMQITFNWFIPLVILFFGSWPFVFFYLAFVIQYKRFNLQNKIINIILILPHVIVNAVMRFLFLLCKGEEFEKHEFKKIFLSYDKLFLSDQVFLQKVKLDSNSVSSNLNNRSQPEATNKDLPQVEFQEINLRYLIYVEIICVGSMILISALALLIFYFRARI